MERSQYLAQALQQMQAAPSQASGGLDLSAMQMSAEQRRAWEAAHPGQSYIINNLQQVGQNVMQAPQNVMAAPGNAASGLAQLPQRLGVR